jgi:hypothetical protein
MAAGRPALLKTLIPLLCSLAIFFAWSAVSNGLATGGPNDFLAFYAGGKLAGTGALYHPDAVRQVEIKACGGWSPALLFIRPAFYAHLLKPLTMLPFAQALILWKLLLIAAVLGSVMVLWREAADYALLCAISLPLLLSIGNGQDVALLMLAASGALVLLRRNRDLAAGLVLSLCAIKFHLLVLVPVAFVMTRKWRALGGFLAGIATLAAASIGLEGTASIREYLAILARPGISPHAEQMGNLRTLAEAVHLPGIELALAAMVVLLACAAMRGRDTETGLAFAIAAGLVLSGHAYPQDFALLLPFLALFRGKTMGRPEKLIAQCLLLPFPYLLLFLGRPFDAALPLLIIALLICGAMARGFYLYAGMPVTRSPITSA